MKVTISSKVASVLGMEDLVGKGKGSSQQGITIPLGKMAHKLIRKLLDEVSNLGVIRKGKGKRTAMSVEDRIETWLNDYDYNTNDSVRLNKFITRVKQVQSNRANEEIDFEKSKTIIKDMVNTLDIFTGAGIQKSKKKAKLVKDIVNMLPKYV